MTPTRVFTVADLESEYIPFGGGEPGGMYYDGFDGYDLPRDMRDEIREALRSGREARVEVWGRSYAWFPNSGRGGVDPGNGGVTQWSDADSLDDLEARWGEYQARIAAGYDPADWPSRWSD